RRRTGGHGGVGGGVGVPAGDAGRAERPHDGRRPARGRGVARCRRGVQHGGGAGRVGGPTVPSHMSGPPCAVVWTAPAKRAIGSAARGGGRRLGCRCLAQAPARLLAGGRHHGTSFPWPWLPVQLLGKGAMTASMIEPSVDIRRAADRRATRLSWLN